MNTERPYLVLGMDPGIASCGFALLDMTNHKILEMGSHLFDAPQNPKNGESNAVARRNARSIRRNTDRTQARRKHCLALLKENGLVPKEADSSWLQTVRGDKPILKLRSVGLDRLLTNREFAQVLYSLVTRRGYIPHGEGRLGETEDVEGKKVLAAIKENLAKMEQGGYRTVGEMLYSGGTSRNKQGKYELCVYNSQIVDEAHLLFAAQRALGSNDASPEFEQNYIECLTWEKKTSSHDEKVYSLVGSCSYFPEEKRAAQADLSSELCRAYERFGHLVIVEKDGCERTLSKEQVELFISTLFSPVPIKGNKDCKVRYSDIRKALDLKAHSVFKGIDPDKEKTDEPFAPKAWRLMRKNGISPDLLTRMFEDRPLADAIGEALTYASSEESLLGRLTELDLSQEEIDELCGLPFSGKVFKGYGKRGLKALWLLLDVFEDDSILTLNDAEQACGLQDKRLSDKGGRTVLLPPYDFYDPTCNNPVVLRAMSRMRKIVNSIIRIYGVPDEIHIELDRDLKHSAREKDLINKNNQKNQAERKRHAELAAGILGISEDEVPGKILRKLSLWEEQDQLDPYTGDSIQLERLIRDERYTEIDHILPFSRTCDDSRKNKVLVLQKSNQDKRERTPYEWMTEDQGAPSWDEYESRILNSPKLSRKRAHLLNKKLDEEAQANFLNRNLNDTRYMSRAVKDFLEDSLLFPEDSGRKKHVSAVAGGATANLRWVWGLNYGDDGSKDREDPRHHAVDAAIIAACSEATVKRVALARSKGREAFKRHRESRLADTQPWPSFAIDVDSRRERVVPTRMVSHGVTGRAFQDTIYKLEGFTEDNRKLALLRGKTTPAGNIRILPDGKAAQLIDGIAFLRLWLDPEERRGNSGFGRWYAEPVYYADIPDIRAGRHIPRAVKIHVARTSWEPVPESAMQQPPLIVFRNDVLAVDEQVGRYGGININSCSLSMYSLLTEEELRRFPTISSWRADTDVRVIEEDCLGHCWESLPLSPSDSED